MGLTSVKVAFLAVSLSQKRGTFDEHCNMKVKTFKTGASGDKTKVKCKQKIPHILLHFIKKIYSGFELPGK